MLQRLLPVFRAEQPGVELVLRETTSVAILQQLEDNTLDIGNSPADTVVDSGSGLGQMSMT